MTRHLSCPRLAHMRGLLTEKVRLWLKFQRAVLLDMILRASSNGMVVIRSRKIGSMHVLQVVVDSNLSEDK